MIANVVGMDHRLSKSGWGITGRSASEATNNFTRHLLPSLMANLHADYVTNTEVIINALQSD